jgi:hypothetical protein
MFFDTTKAMLKEIRADVQASGPIKSVAFKVYCLIAFAEFVCLQLFYSLGLSELLTWALWAACLFPVMFLYVLWEENAVKSNALWPKVWYFRKTQIWPRQM